MHILTLYPKPLECFMLTPRWLPHLLFTCVNGLLEPLDASSEKTKTAMRRVVMVLRHFKEKLRDIQST